MSHIYLLSSRLHAAKGYESIGQDSGPHRAGVRLIFHSSDGQTIEATDLAVAFMKRDGDRSALYMREIRVSGLFPICHVSAAADLLRQVSDASIKDGRFPDDILRQLRQLAEPEERGASPAWLSSDLFTALNLSRQKGGCVYAAPESAEKLTEAVLDQFPPARWGRGQSEFSVLWDESDADSPIDADDICDLNFTESACPTRGPSWRFAADGQLISGTLPEPVAEIAEHRRPGRRARAERPKPQPRSFVYMFRCVLTVVLLAIGAAVLALACRADWAAQPVQIILDLSSLKAVFCLIYGLIAGWLIGQARR